MSKIINISNLENQLPSSVKQDAVSFSALNSRNLNSRVTISSPPKKSRWVLISLLITVVIVLVGFILLSFFDFNFKVFENTVDIFDNNTCTGKICQEYQDVSLDTSKCVGVFCNNSVNNLPKTNNRTNILLSGIDTREKGSSTYLTDTIMLLSYDHTSGILYSISFPRDIVVTYENYYEQIVSSKINEVYYNGGAIEDHHEEGILTLQKKIEEITGLSIHYNSMITLRGFTDLIDILGGVDVNLAEEVTDVYPLSELPTDYAKKNCVSIQFVEDGQYCLWRLPSGQNHLDGQTALVYARSRKYSSDWVRAARQQDVINSIRAKISSSTTLSNPQKLGEIVNTLKDNIKVSKYTTNDILAALDLKDKYKKNIQIVLDPKFGGGNLIGSGPSGTYFGSHQVIFDKTYKSIQKYLGYIYNNSAFYTDKPNIFIYSDIAVSNLKNDYSVILAEESNYPGATVSYLPITNAVSTFKFLTPTISSSSLSTSSTTAKVGEETKINYKVYLYDYSGNQKKASIDYILNKFPEITLINNDGKSSALNGEDFAIIIKKE